MIKMKDSKKRNKVNLVYRKAKFEFEFIKTIVCGIQLVGSEARSVREGNVNFSGSFCYFNEGELFIKGLTISSTGNHYSHDPLRDRKLLLKRGELDRLDKALINNLTIVPYRVFENDKNLFKMEIALARGKKLYDKRESIKERDMDRESNRNNIN